MELRTVEIVIRILRLYYAARVDNLERVDAGKARKNPNRHSGSAGTLRWQRRLEIPGMELVGSRPACQLQVAVGVAVVSERAGNWLEVGLMSGQSDKRSATANKQPYHQPEPATAPCAIYHPIERPTPALWEGKGLRFTSKR